MLGSAAESDDAADPALDAAGLLQFLDGSRLHGRLRSADPASGVSWEHPEAKALIGFAPTNLAWIRFERVAELELRRKPTCRFLFHNGDEVFGNLISLDGDRLDLETWFGDKLQTARQSLRSIVFLAKGYSIIYEGPTSLDGWIEGPGQQHRVWQYRDGALVAKGVGLLGRDLKLARSSSVEFDLAWSGQFSLVLVLYTEHMERLDYSTSSYMFFLSTGYIGLQRVQGGAGMIQLGQASVPKMLRENKAHLEIRVNKDDATIVLLADGELVQRWKDQAGFVAKGSGILFYPQLDGPTLRISNLRVSEWDARLDAEEMASPSDREDVAFLVNQDKVSGTLRGVRDGKLAFATAQSSLDIPMERVTQVFLATPQSQAAPPGPWSVRAHFARGGSLSFRIEKWGRQEIVAQSSHFGLVRLDPRSIRQLQFNPDRSHTASEPEDYVTPDIWDYEP